MRCKAKGLISRLRPNPFAKPSLAATYNLSYGDNATALPEAFYDIPVKNVTIQPGGISGDDIIVNFVNLNQLDDSRRYVLPVTITNVSGIGLLESARTTYFIIKGAALINVVANIKENYFPIKWNRICYRQQIRV